jgi:hypothetical protein
MAGGELRLGTVSIYMATHISFNRSHINDIDQLDGYLHGYISKHWNALRPRVYWLQRTFTAILRGEDQSGKLISPSGSSSCSSRGWSGGGVIGRPYAGWVASSWMGLHSGPACPRSSPWRAWRAWTPTRERNATTEGWRVCAHRVWGAARRIIALLCAEAPLRHTGLEALLREGKKKRPFQSTPLALPRLHRTNQLRGHSRFAEGLWKQGFGELVPKWNWGTSGIGC